MLKNGPQHRAIWTLVIAAIATAFAALPLGAQDKPASSDQIILVTSGSGADESSALKQAFNNAIEEAIGTIVDSETVVKDDKIISDQVLTASNAIVSHYDPVGDPRVDGGLVTVKIRAVVEKKQLTDRLAAANVTDKQVNGSDLFAQAVTDLQREKDAAVIVRRAFDGFPGNVLKAEAVGDPRLISKTDTDAKIDVTVRFSIDMDKYAKWQEAFVPLLTKVATSNEDDRFNPGKSWADLGCNITNKAGFAGIWVPKEDLTQSYVIGVRSAHDYRLSIYQRRGSSKVTVLTFGPDAFREVEMASLAVPFVEVILKDEKGEELDGQNSVATYLTAHYFGAAYVTASPFWVKYDKFIDLGVNIPKGLSDPNWYPSQQGVFSSQSNATVKEVMIVPYCLMARGGGTKPSALSGFTKEFVFTLPMDSLKRLKTVEVKISSRNNALTREERSR